MKIEIVIALVLGTLLGLGGMFFVAQLTAHPTPQTQKLVQNAAIPDASPSAQIASEISSPLPLESWDLSPLLLKGSSKSGTFAFLVSDTGDTVLPLTSGSFDTTTQMTPGVTAYRIFSQYTDRIGESVIVSFNDLAKHKKIKFGTVTDLTAESLQMRSGDGTIDQVAFIPNIIVGTFVKDTKKITPNDIAIGDRVVIAVDSVDKGITVALGVFVIPSDFGKPDYLLKTGILKSISKNDLVVSTKEGDLSVKTDSNTKFFGVKENGVTRKRTKLITTDVERTVYITYLKDTPNIRSIFISE